MLLTLVGPVSRKLNRVESSGMASSLTVKLPLSIIRLMKVQMTSSPNETSMLLGLDPSEHDTSAGSQPAGTEACAKEYPDRGCRPSNVCRVLSKLNWTLDGVRPPPAT